MNFPLGAAQRWIAWSGFLAISSAVSAQTTPQLSTVAFGTNGEFVLKVTGPGNRNGTLVYQVQTSTNLIEWTGWRTFAMPGAGSLQHTDTAAPYLNTRYYRAVRPAETNLLTGDYLQTTNGDAILHPVNHASLVVSWNGKMIYNDPVGDATLYQSFPRANLILISHSHSDHFDTTTLAAVAATNTIILAPQAVYASLTGALKTQTLVLTNGSSTNVLGISVQTIPAYNTSSAYHPKGTGNGYIITLGGRRVYLSGDTEDITEMRTLQNIDVAFVCMNVPYTMDITKAAAAVRAFHPGAIYPYHYLNSDNSYADLDSFKQKVGRDLHIEVRLRAWY